MTEGQRRYKASPAPRRHCISIFFLPERPLAFLSRGDSYKLRHKDPSGNNITGEGDYIFDNIGTDKESKIVEAKKGNLQAHSLKSVSPKYSFK